MARGSGGLANHDFAHLCMGVALDGGHHVGAGGQVGQAQRALTLGGDALHHAAIGGDDAQGAAGCVGKVIVQRAACQAEACASTPLMPVVGV